MSNIYRSNSGMVRYYTAAWALALASCGGYSVDLDATAPASGGAGSGGSAAMIQQVPLSESIVEFRVDESRVYWITLGAPDFKLQSCVYESCAGSGVTYGMSQGPIILGADDLFFPKLPGTAINGFDNNYTLFRSAKSGLGGEKPFTQGVFAFLEPAIDADYFYWQASFDVYRCPLAGCGEIPQIVAASYVPMGPLRLMGDQIYWVDYGPELTENPGIYSAPKDGSGESVELTPGYGTADVVADDSDLAVDEANIYWIAADFRILSCPRAGCAGHTPVTLVSTDTPKESLLVDEAGIYWLDTAGYSGAVNTPIGTVRFCPLSGCLPGTEPAALTPNAAREFRLNSQYLYWNEPLVTTDDQFGVDRVIYRTRKPTL